jgi:methylated-DNA-[protein]-cysteine S-methyltransferase
LPSYFLDPAAQPETGIVAVIDGADVRQPILPSPADILLARQLESKNPVEFPPGPYEFHDRSKCEGHVTGRADHYLIFETAGGFCGIAWNSAGITRFQLPTKSATATERFLLRRMPGAKPGAPTPEVAEAVAAVRRYFEGMETDFSVFKLDLGEQDPFFERVYTAARRVGWGRTTTYGALAKGLGAGPEAARDVGQAMAKNPVALIIPCHRVLAAGGRVGGFSAPGGSAAKIRMLALEGVQIESTRSAQQSFGF